MREKVLFTNNIMKTIVSLVGVVAFSINLLAAITVLAANGRPNEGTESRGSSGEHGRSGSHEGGHSGFHGGYGNYYRHRGYYFSGGLYYPYYFYDSMPESDYNTAPSPPVVYGSPTTDYDPPTVIYGSQPTPSVIYGSQPTPSVIYGSQPQPSTPSPVAQSPPVQPSIQQPLVADPSVIAQDVGKPSEPRSSTSPANAVTQKPWWEKNSVPLVVGEVGIVVLLIAVLLRPSINRKFG